MLTVGSLGLQIRCISPKTSKEDGNHPTRQVRLHILRKDHCQAPLSRNLELQVMPQDGRWRSIHCRVRTNVLMIGEFSQ